MAYCTHEDVLKFAPQAEPGVDLDGYIQQAGGVIDANLRANYSLPLATPYPQLLIDLAAQFTAGYYLSASYTKVNRQVPDYVKDMLTTAHEQLLLIRGDLSLLGIAPKEPTTEDYDKNSVLYGQPSENVFDSTDELDWER